MNRTGVLLINLGTPDAPTPAAVGKYLREFLMDGYVIDVPFLVRWFLVNVVIVPRRRHQSAKLYQKIQTVAGSPLLVETRKLTEGVSRELITRRGDYVVEFAMRYGNPSIASSLGGLRSAGVSRVVVLPLYPQYAESSFETAVVETRRAARALGYEDWLTFLPPFYDRESYIDACAARVREHLNDKAPEHLIFSFHGLPERHLRRLDYSGAHCLVRHDCCASMGQQNQRCYRAQCFATARAITRRLGLEEEFYTVSFQSRLGRAKWIEPVTENALGELARRGVKRVSVFCPSFVADCLETLEEIAIRGRETFVHGGGSELFLIPALNGHPLWVKAIADWIVGSTDDKS
jgi:ferrochelatase